MNKEIWKDITGYEGLYQVSDQGRVKSLERKFHIWHGGERIQKERILKQATTHNGYLRVTLYAGDKPKTLKVHRLVCEAFHKNPNNKPEVNHINENRTDNRACNLEWCTRRENCNHGTHNERVAKALSKTVGQFSLDGKLIKVWQSASEVRRQIGFNQGYVSAAARGEHKQAYGFIWKYI
ncbi:DNA endonuclease [Streptococcus phage SG586P1]|nr:DNA endonuclease [Streptococcus phage SG586P1]WAX18007.1 DNA endonuclease [Streptococcus phage SG586P3]